MGGEPNLGADLGDLVIWGFRGWIDDRLASYLLFPGDRSALGSANTPGREELVVVVGSNFESKSV